MVEVFLGEHPPQEIDIHEVKKEATVTALEDIGKRIRSAYRFSQDKAIILGGLFLTYRLMNIYAQEDSVTSPRNASDDKILMENREKLRIKRGRLEIIYAEMRRGDYGEAKVALAEEITPTIGNHGGFVALVDALPESGRKFPLVRNSWEVKKYREVAEEKVQAKRKYPASGMPLEP